MTIIKKFETEQPKKTFPKKYISLVTACLFMLMLIEVWANNNVVAYGEKLEKLSTLTKALSLENQILENEIAKSEALKNVASKSAELGFSQAQSIQYIR